jgi:hypothetical protein
VGQVALAAAARRRLEGDAHAALLGVGGERCVDLAEVAQVVGHAVRGVVGADRGQPPEVHPEGRAGVGDDRADPERGAGVDCQAECGTPLLAQPRVGRQQVEHRREGGDRQAVGVEEFADLARALLDDCAQVEVAGVAGAGDARVAGANVDLDRLQAVAAGAQEEFGEGQWLDPDE